MKLHKMVCLLMALLLLAGLLPLTAVNAAAQEQIDLSRSVSVTVSYRVQEHAAAGVDFSLYQVGTLTQAGEASLTGAFRDYPVSLAASGASEWKALAQTLAGYVLRDGILPDQSGSTDANGSVTLSGGLYPGVYLLLGGSCTMDGTAYAAGPVLLTLPESGGEGLIYDVSVVPKYEEAEGSGNLTVEKIWKDAGRESGRPAQLKVVLIDGTEEKQYGTVTLTGENGWRHTWKNLPQGHSWYVVEQVPEGYTVTSQRDGSTIVLTNTSTATTATTEPGDSILPQTGTLQWLVPVLAVCGTLLFLTGWLWRRRDEQA